MAESSPWYEVIRRFVRSKVFETPFALRLLYKTLQEACETPETLAENENNQLKMDFNSTNGPKYLLPSDLGENAQDRSVIEDISKCKTLKSETNGSLKKFGSEESSTFDKTLDSNVSDSTVPYFSDDAKSLDVNVPDGDGNDTSSVKCVTNESENDETSKIIFFSSEENTDNSSSSQKRPRKRRRSSIQENSDKKSDNETKSESDKKNTSEMELRELEKLLRMTEVKEVTTKPSASNTEKKTNTCQKKPEEVGLIDCFTPGEASTNCSNPESLEEKESLESLLAELNDEVKNCFLLSTSEEGSSEDETQKTKEEPPQKIKKKKELTKKDSVSQKRKSCNLRAYRVSETSSEDTAAEDFEKNSTISVPIETVIESSDSVETIDKTPNQKKKKTSTEKDSQRSLSESSSDGIEICNSQPSPTKGRKNIKQIIKKESLQEETKQALKVETERKKRLSERQKLFNEVFPGTDASGMVLDFDPDTKEKLVVVDDILTEKLKPHQKEGVRFMWNSCFESLKRMAEDSGSGCVLAHCMGLGKTLQVICLVYTLLTHKVVRTVMILCPLNTIKNWNNEFKLWLKNAKETVYAVDITVCKNMKERINKIRSWNGNGGVLLISYEMFRSMIKKNVGKQVLTNGLISPGPDLVVCDEGHVLKNEFSILSKCISQIKTLRRIVLTGTPLQNNLIEYYCMVQFVKPNLLGTRKEFMNRFVNPINNGQFEDSTQLDVRIMKRRAHVLHTMLDGFIQRFSYNALTPFLPEKQEYVISISLTEAQTNLYRVFINKCERRTLGLLRDFHCLQRVWTHPKIIFNYLNKVSDPGEESKEMLNYCEKYFTESDYDDLRGSGKLVLLFRILKKCKEIGDKVLLFSQSLNSLNLIQDFLKKAHKLYLTDPSHEFADKWESGVTYYRLDGSTNSSSRDTYCRNFNKSKEARLFLISTRAGGLGINLVGANRVIVFDASWNPTHDVQSIFRVYRFGQEKPCYIYRFLASGTMEEKIYKRQVTKLSLAHRILDEHQIERHYTMGNLQELYKFDPIPKEKWEIPKLPKDSLFAEILNSNRDIIVGYHEHDSLLENKEEEELTEEERRVAWEEYEKEKQAPTIPQHPNLSNGMPKGLYMDKLNNEALKVVHRYKQGIAVTTNGTQTKPDSLILNNNQNESFKIVNVRSLAESEPVSDFHFNRVLDFGRSLGLKPYEGEDSQKYYSRVLHTIKVVCPWFIQNKGGI